MRLTFRMSLLFCLLGSPAACFAQADPSAPTNKSTDKSTSTTLPAGVDVVIGIGSLITGNHTDYKVNTPTNLIEGSQIGRASPQYLAGVAFQLPMGSICCKPKPIMSTVNGKSVDTNAWKEHPWNAFVSLKFATGSTTTLSGYVFGMSYKIHPNLSLLAGYALTGFNEPSPGFRNAAVAAVANNPKLYPTFNAAALNNNVAGAFDGFPLVNQGAGSTSNLYAGDPLETHYRGGFVIGISITKTIATLFGNSSSN